MDALKTVHAAFNDNLRTLHNLTNSDITKMKQQFEQMIDPECNLIPLEYFTKAVEESFNIIQYLVKDFENTLALNSCNYVKIFN